MRRDAGSANRRPGEEAGPGEQLSSGSWTEREPYDFPALLCTHGEGRVMNDTRAEAHTFP